MLNREYLKWILKYKRTLKTNLCNRDGFLNTTYLIGPQGTTPINTYINSPSIVRRESTVRAIKNYLNRKGD